MPSSISDQTSPDSINQSDASVNEPAVRIGGWLFRHRTIIPLPLAAAVLLLRIGEAGPSTFLVAIGVAVTLLGEAIRLWAVRHIGVISRTRSERLGPLVDTGPFAWVRNPLYVGNILLWAGFALSARLVWLAPLIVLLLAFEYHAIVRWEEQLLEARMGAPYREYRTRVPRWMPRARLKPSAFARRILGATADKSRACPPKLAGSHARGGGNALAERDWRDTLFTERGTLIAMAAGYALLWLKARF
jgi:protein-S-isoprenylcysteine O-methyltransferase Ste14